MVSVFCCVWCSPKYQNMHKMRLGDAGQSDSAALPGPIRSHDTTREDCGVRDTRGVDDSARTFCTCAPSRSCVGDPRPLRARVLVSVHEHSCLGVPTSLGLTACAYLLINLRESMWLNTFYVYHARSRGMGDSSSM
jgi:hypothetical protein